ncbi:alpha/beta hydrolase [Chloroflexota bacterium]
MLINDVGLEIDGVDIAGHLYLPDGQVPFSTVCICHGIPDSLPAPGDRGYPLLAEKICRHGFAAFIFNFRGTGDSGGNLDILGWTSDLKGVIDYLYTLPEVDRSRLALLGFSGGAAVAIYVAAQDRRISSVVACASPAEFTRFKESDDPQAIVDHFRSIGAIRESNFPASIAEWHNGFNLVSPVEYVARIAPIPLLIVHGSKDEMVDVSHAYRLFDKAGDPRQIIIIDGAEHRLRQDEKAVACVIDWLKSRYQNR